VEEDVRQRNEREEVWVKWSCTVDIYDCFKSNLKYFSFENNVTIKKKRSGARKMKK
jgi:hypothetical protein